MILPNITHYEIETLAGLEEFTTNELTSKFGEQARVIAKSGNGHIVVDYSADDLAVSYFVLQNGTVVLLDVTEAGPDEPSIE